MATAVAVLCCGFAITQAFTVGVIVVTCSFYLYFGDFNARLVVEAADEKSEKELLLSGMGSAPAAEKA